MFKLMKFCRLSVFASSLVGVLSLLSSLSFAQTPNCLGAQGQTLPVNDSQVITYKSTTPNQFLARAHIQGILQHAYADKTGHSHFEVKIGAGPKDNIEVVYNQSFGALPQLAPGMVIEACGDYITSNAATSQYPASPDGAIIHWVHRSTGNHASGYVVAGGILCGQGAGDGHSSTF